MQFLQLVSGVRSGSIQSTISVRQVEHPREQFAECYIVTHSTQHLPAEVSRRRLIEICESKKIDYTEFLLYRRDLSPSEINAVCDSVSAEIILERIAANDAVRNANDADRAAYNADAQRQVESSRASLINRVRAGRKLTNDVISECNAAAAEFDAERAKA